MPLPTFEALHAHVQLTMPEMQLTLCTSNRALQTSQLILDYGIVTTIAWMAPCHNASICQNCSKSKARGMDLLNMSICTMSGMTAISRITIEMPKIWSNELRYFGQLGFLCWLSSRAYLWHYSKLYAEIC